MTTKKAKQMSDTNISSKRKLQQIASSDEEDADSYEREEHEGEDGAMEPSESESESEGGLDRQNASKKTSRRMEAMEAAKRCKRMEASEPAKATLDKSERVCSAVEESA
eukprot:CAMPEP_0198224642 /NCGR_PEP_ID=MMETSP1445-20131203/97762_1 /TAXON_ID=36898 /ORGANISM="Pyramimonas sp., Strain CCMP2087" /LENGTH=108 /DNA_ID=CAMNT_0043903873 /DNA_START=129 /DNA_END=451 /DNA_ORIENTATION=-